MTTASLVLEEKQTGRAWFGSLLELMTLLIFSVLLPRGVLSATHYQCSMVESGRLPQRCLLVWKQKWEFARRDDHGGTDSIQTSGRLGIIMVAISARIKSAPAKLGILLMIRLLTCSIG
jgi:hypothetical protein